METAKKVIVKIEGQVYEIDAAIANGGTTVQESDQLLRDALRPSFEIAAGATFQRETHEDGTLTITLIKQPGPKGTGLQCLLDAPSSMNPAIEIACELHLLEARGGLDLATVLAMQPRIERAIRSGAAEEQAITNTLRVLLTAPAIVNSDVPSSF